MRGGWKGKPHSGLLGAVLHASLSEHVEVEHAQEKEKRAALSPKAKPIVYRLSALFAVDALGGGLIGQSILSYYFYVRYALNLSTLGAIFFATQIVTALSFLLAERIARRIGLLRTMVFSHIPSNVFLTAVAFAPTPVSAVFLLLCRQSLSQMDVPTRQSYAMAIVDEPDRTATAGLTSSTRTVASSISPSIAGYAMQAIWIASLLVASGLLKLAYDFMIYAGFRKIKPPEEMHSQKT